MRPNRAQAGGLLGAIQAYAGPEFGPFAGVSLLRGVNVGGTKLVKMPELRAALERMGFAEVATYIASGFG